jgi:hypothetical protein
MNTDPVKMLPCPFCEGPPVAFSTADRSGFVLEDDGSMVDAYVFCHECGAQGPNVDGLIFEMDEVRDLKDQAVKLWQERCAKHRGMYDAGEVERLNEYPRPDIAHLDNAR